MASCDVNLWIKIAVEVEQRLDACVGQRLADCVLVVDHKSKMAAVISGLRTALLEREVPLLPRSSKLNNRP